MAKNSAQKTGNATSGELASLQAKLAEVVCHLSTIAKTLSGVPSGAPAPSTNGALSAPTPLTNGAPAVPHASNGTAPRGPVTKPGLSPTLPADLVSPKTAAKLLGVHVSTIYRFVTTGRLRSYWIAGTRHRVSRRDVESMARIIEPRAEIATQQQLDRDHKEAVESLRARGYRI